MGVVKFSALALGVLVVAGCAGGTTQTTATAPAAAASSSSANAQLAVAVSQDVLVNNAIVRVGTVENEDLLRDKMEKFKSGVYWSRGARETDALIEIGSEGAVSVDDADGVSAGSYDGTRLSGRISLLDAATGATIVEPIAISVTIGGNRDVIGGLGKGSREGVELEYLVQKFMLAARETLYGKGV